MRISEFIGYLQTIQKEHGDLPILGGYLSDDTPPQVPTVLNSSDEDINHGGGEAVGVFFE